MGSHQIHRAALLAAATVLLGSAATHADSIDIIADTAASTEGLGDFTGTIQYDHLGGENGSLIISLTNTSPLVNGGFITGFVFNINSADAAAAATLTSATFADLINAPNNSAVPFGNPYDAGAAIGGDFLGGGSPNGGIGVGQTGVFNFAVTALDASSLTALNFITGPYQHNFIVRFRGFLDDGSDKVPATVVPGPAALCSLALGIVVLPRRRRH
jgi:hypothetical protein